MREIWDLGTGMERRFFCTFILYIFCTVKFLNHMDILSVQNLSLNVKVLCIHMYTFILVHMYSYIDTCIHLYVCACTYTWDRFDYSRPVVQYLQHKNFNFVSRQSLSTSITINGVEYRCQTQIFPWMEAVQQILWEVKAGGLPGPRSLRPA